MIRYTGEKFIPETITASQSPTGLGCFLTIINEAGVPLLLRLNPHEKARKGNYGFAYDPIPPGETAIIDGRYGRPEESFHNFNNPAHEFSVRFDTSCLEN